MTQSEIAEKVIPFLIKEFEIEVDLIKPEANLRETLELDSLDYIDLIVIVENAFSIKVTPTDFQNIITFQDFYNYLESKVNNSQESVTN